MCYLYRSSLKRRVSHIAFCRLILVALTLTESVDAQTSIPYKLLFKRDGDIKPHIEEVLRYIETSESDSSIAVLNDYLFQLSDSLMHSSKETDKTTGLYYLPNILGNRGYLHDNLGQYEAAQSDYFKAYVLALHVNNIEAIASNCNNIGTIFSRSADHYGAENYFGKSFDAYANIQAREGMAITLNNEGGVHLHLGKYEDAAMFFRKSFDIRQMLADKAGMARCLNNLAAVKNRQGLLQLAVEYNYEAIRLQSEEKDKFGKLHSLQSLALCYYDLNQWDSARIYAEQSVRLAKSIGVQGDLETSEDILNDILSKTRHKALTKPLESRKDSFIKKEAIYFKTATQFKDSLVKVITQTSNSSSNRTLIWARSILVLLSVMCFRVVFVFVRKRKL
jgi:tetratricopeptide (TPR) repeat protein